MAELTTPFVPRAGSQFGCRPPVETVCEVSRWKISLLSAVPLVSRIKQMPPSGMRLLFGTPLSVREKAISISPSPSLASVLAPAKLNTGTGSLSRMVKVYLLSSGLICLPRALGKPAPSSNTKVYVSSPSPTESSTTDTLKSSKFVPTTTLNVPLSGDKSPNLDPLNSLPSASTAFSTRQRKGIALCARRLADTRTSNVPTPSSTKLGLKVPPPLRGLSFSTNPTCPPLRSTIVPVCV